VAAALALAINPRKPRRVKDGAVGRKKEDTPVCYREKGGKAILKPGPVAIPVAVRTKSRYFGGVNRREFITAPTLAPGAAAAGCVTRAPAVKPPFKIPLAGWSRHRAWREHFLTHGA